MDGAPISGYEARDRGTTPSDRTRRYRLALVTPMRDLRALLSAGAVPFEVHGREFRVNLKQLSYWIPFLAGLGVMVGGMKTAGTPFLGLPQLAVGITLTALACWYFVSDSGRLDLGQSQPAPRSGALSFDGAQAVVADGLRRSPRKYTDDFRRHAVAMVRSTGWPIARVARELDVSPGTLGGWVKKDRMERLDPPP